MGCGGQPEDLIEETTQEGAIDEEGKADTVTVPFTVFTDDVGSAGQSETRQLFSTAAAYKAYFGHAAPASVDFSREYAFFYSAGVKNTGGYRASVTRMSLSSGNYYVNVTTRLESPGADCIVTQAFTKPYVLVKFKKPTPRPWYVRYYRSNIVRECTPTDPCATVRCAAGTTCDSSTGSARCLKNVFCGGIAGIGCPGAGTCIDNPNDSCDPNNGGADCGGLCRCTAIGLCVPGSVWDSSPEVCGCKPAGGVQCGSNTCAAGQVCCNASCGICTAPGQFCIQIACN